MFLVRNINSWGGALRDCKSKMGVFFFYLKLFHFIQSHSKQLMFSGQLIKAF